MTSTAYVWFDTEYSTLELGEAHLLQVAVRVTDSELQPIDPMRRDVNVWVKLPDGVPVSPWIMENMPEVVARCRSAEAVEIADLDRHLTELIDRVVGSPGDFKRRPILAGNSVHADWYLAKKYLPGFLSRLHYRHLDVTALKIQWQDWLQGEDFDKDQGELVAKFCPEPKIDIAAKRHDAYYDVQASIAELNYYRTKFFLPRPTTLAE